MVAYNTENVQRRLDRLCETYDPAVEDDPFGWDEWPGE